MQEAYVDFHVHSSVSDGQFSCVELVKIAKSAGIQLLAITDHNRLSPDLNALTREVGGGITLVRGCEMSCIHVLSTGKRVELHIVLLNYREDAPALSEIAARNHSKDRRAYIQAILDRLAQCGINIGSYDDLCAKYPCTSRPGRMSIASELVQQGYVSSIDEAFNEFLGAHGKRAAFVENPIQYVSLSDTVSAAIQDCAIPVLAHLFYYQSLTREEQEELVATFHEMSGPAGAMEVEYGRYTREQRDFLRAMADRWSLAYSAGSDFHGQNKEEHLHHHFPLAIGQALLERQRQVYGPRTPDII